MSRLTDLAPTSTSTTILTIRTRSDASAATAGVPEPLQSCGNGPVFVGPFGVHGGDGATRAYQHLRSLASRELVLFLWFRKCVGFHLGLPTNFQDSLTFVFSPLIVEGNSISIHSTCQLLNPKIQAPKPTAPKLRLNRIPCGTCGRRLQRMVSTTSLPKILRSRHQGSKQLGSSYPKASK